MMYRASDSIVLTTIKVQRDSRAEAKSFFAEIALDVRSPPPVVPLSPSASEPCPDLITSLRIHSWSFGKPIWSSVARSEMKTADPSCRPRTLSFGNRGDQGFPSDYGLNPMGRCRI